MNAVECILSVLCNHVKQVVPAHRVDDIEDAHQVDPIHQVAHKMKSGVIWGRLSVAR